MNNEPWMLDATELAQRIRRRDISCHEAMQSCLHRLDAVNPRINAVVDCRPEAALAEARAADEALARGEPAGPLHGVPVTIKINVDQRGWATTNGIAARRGDIASADSPVVANLRKAGAVPLGRTNTPAFSMRWFTDNDAHGRTFNPHNAQLTPGGSSGGAAAAVACGLGPIAHGNDQGGSIRYPAHACGVYGLRPSAQRVPAFNPSMPSRALAFELTSVQGPLARSVADLRLALAAMSARDPRDPWWVPAPLEGRPDRQPIRVALYTGQPGFTVDPEVVLALEQAASLLEDAGYRVEPAELPRFADCARLWFELTINDTRLTLEQALMRDGDDAIRHAYRAMASRVPQPLDLPGYLALLSQRTTLRRAWSLFMEQYPLVLMPVSFKRPFPVDADQVPFPQAQALFDAQSPLLAVAALGLPGLAVPLPSPAGMPTGVQLVAGLMREDLCLSAAEVLELRNGRLSPVDPA
ncbi:Glutamyl-tRNA(Gln) amidotransferase subunit A [Delftia tsuruhatensis]|uniref:amidase family protein n=1 Tax=Delftia tsuruhatensis TaxID=180282 RepID=UPI001E78998C|nr:amidase family protein [Delftia tsuruhatensis]CAB5714215.1 Glutamyl-tRNA(Gln) amidotransferase subunit A [Delftia tsuruhatensis]CAC9688944.1 Glutamyl-tRNA(Gln) amidotransferase subunit A [Delftia tsuruhatensis]